MRIATFSEVRDSAVASAGIAVLRSRAKTHGVTYPLPCPGEEECVEGVTGYELDSFGVFQPVECKTCGPFDKPIGRDHPLEVEALLAATPSPYEGFLEAVRR